MFGRASQAHWPLEKALDGMMSSVFKRFPGAVHLGRYLKSSCLCCDRLDGLALSAAPDTKEDHECITLFYGTIDGELACTHCLKVRWVLENMGLRYRLVGIDLHDNKPQWYTDEISAKGSTPAAWMRGEFYPESGDILAAVVALAAGDEAAVDDAGRSFASRSVGDDVQSQVKGLGGVGFGVLLSDPETDSDHETKCEKLRLALAKLDRELSSSGPYVCGAAPGVLDAEAILYSVVLGALEKLCPWLSLSSSYPGVAGWIGLVRGDEMFGRASQAHWPLEKALDGMMSSVFKRFPGAAHLGRYLKSSDLGEVTPSLRPHVPQQGSKPSSTQPRRVFVQPASAHLQESDPSEQDQIDQGLLYCTVQPRSDTVLPGFIHMADDSTPGSSPLPPSRDRSTSAWKRLALAKSAVSAFSFRDDGSSENMSTTVASSGTASWLNPRHWYFLMLDMSWIKLVVCLSLIYAVCSLIFAALTLPILNGIANDNDAIHSSTIALWFATSNIVTASYSPYYVPQEGNTGTWLFGTFQQLVGILLQAALFSVTVTRFQMPAADFFFSESVLVMTRDGVPHIQVRIGNKRCNMIFHPDVRMTLLTQRTTREAVLLNSAYGGHTSRNDGWFDYARTQDRRKQPTRSCTK
jgi:glutathione S-transferase